VIYIALKSRACA